MSYVHNGCVVYQVLLLAGDWEHTHEFLSKLRHHLSNYPIRPAHYPGIQGRCVVGGAPKQALVFITAMRVGCAILGAH